MPRLLSVLAAGLALICLGAAARAAEYCVSCTGPDAAYRCKIEGTPDGPGEDPRAQLLCIRQLAESGAHESCSVVRKSSYPCPGELKVIAGPVGEVVPPASAEPAGEWAPVPSPPAPPPTDGNVEAQPGSGGAAEDGRGACREDRAIVEGRNKEGGRVDFGLGGESR